MWTAELQAEQSKHLIRLWWFQMHHSFLSETSLHHTNLHKKPVTKMLKKVISREAVSDLTYHWNFKLKGQSSSVTMCSLERATTAYLTWQVLWSQKVMACWRSVRASIFYVQITAYKTFTLWIFQHRLSHIPPNRIYTSHFKYISLSCLFKGSMNMPSSAICHF